MKKIILAIAIAALVFAATGVAFAQSLEKIPHPSVIKNYRVIKQDGGALFGYRIIKATSTAATSAEQNVHPNLITPEQLACVKTALDKKDGATKTAYTANNDSRLKSIDSRNACQKTALEKGSYQEQMNGVKLCARNYQKEVKEAGTLLMTTQREIWKTFKDELKACVGRPLTIDDGEDMGAIK